MFSTLPRWCHRGHSCQYCCGFQMPHNLTKVCIPLAALVYLTCLAIYTNTTEYVSQEVRADKTVWWIYRVFKRIGHLLISIYFWTPCNYNTNKLYRNTTVLLQVAWIETLIQFQSSRYSQSGEDGIICRCIFPICQFSCINFRDGAQSNNKDLILLNPAWFCMILYFYVFHHQLMVFESDFCKVITSKHC